jgi:phosphoglycolate phosphatase
VKKAVIFDFDGTLADVATIMRAIYAEEALKRRWPELTDKDYARLRKGTIRQAMKWARIRSWQLPGLLRLGRNLFHARSGEVELFEGIHELIPQLQEDGWDIYVLSINSTATIQEVLKRHKVDKYFQILKRPNLFGKSASIRTLMRSRGYERANVWMVGDEVRDIQAANKAGVNSIAVAWGLQDESLLAQYQPTAVARQAQDIERILKEA